MNSILEISYLLASVSYILGLKMLSNPKAAKRGNLIAAFGMALAIAATLMLYRQGADELPLRNIPLILGALAIGSFIGTLMAKRVAMTAMPQMVSFFNGMGGICAAIISLMEFGHLQPDAPLGEGLSIILGIIIGTVSFSGSMLAYGKLEGKVKDRVLPAQQVVNMVVLGAIAALSIYILSGSYYSIPLAYGLIGLSVIYGLLFVFPIGGADMPVVISLLNSFTGVAAALGGFLYNNMPMLTGGILVGSAGTILTVMMCKAMNRSLTNVLLGAFGAAKPGGSGTGSAVDGAIKEVSIQEAAMLCNYAKEVMVVPGYGLAVAQAQHICHELEKVLEDAGVNLTYAIHPVAGRMPGHMNVLLAEADVEYEKLLELEQANPKFSNADVTLVIGANDVVNPAAKTDKNSPIYGMPILEVDKSKSVIVFKRGMSQGYAGIENELFYGKNTRMLFGDAKATLNKLVEEIKNL